MKGDGAPNVVFVCTDRGQHTRTPLGDLAVIDNALIANTAKYGTLANRRKGECVRVKGHPLDPTGVRVWCPRCRRDKPLRPESARRLVTELSAHDVPEVDLSHL